VKYKGYDEKRDKFPVWADVLGWMMTMFVILTIVIVTIVKIVTARDEGRGVCIFVPNGEFPEILIAKCRSRFYCT
jgi:hypothetical protein